MFTRDDLLALTSETADPTVSVFVPVEREGMDASRTTIQLKNQVQEVERRLEQAGRAPADREAFLAPLHDLIERRALAPLVGERHVLDPHATRERGQGRARLPAAEWPRTFALRVTPATEVQ